ncbi:MAG: RidA family protein [Rhodospirillaceae bacterium]|nr:RidA family protein [Rhodospirillaceae bacterium]MBT6117604.1 RidA family protein [Rhodospirillaceae bacterium]
MARKYVWPKGHWSWPIKVTHKHGLRCDEMIFVGGQVDLTPEGEVLRKGDLAAQTNAVVDHIETVLDELGADLEDVVKLVMFYVNDGGVNERDALATLRARFKGDVPPAVIPVPLPVLAYPEMVVEIEAIAMRSPDGSRMARSASNPATHWDWPFSHGLRCGEMIFIGAQQPLDASGEMVAPGDPVEQARANIENLRAVLDGFGADLGDVARINTFYVGAGTAADWSRAAQIRGNAFEWPGPVGTGVPVPALFPNGMTQRQEAFAMLGVNGEKLERECVRPDGHWDWPIPVNFQQGVKVGKMVFIGGQVCQDHKGVGLHKGEMVRQTVVVMENIRRTLACYGLNMDDMVKVNTFYRGGASYDELHENLSVRSASFFDPGPSTTGIPLAALGIEGLTIEVEGWAMTS